MRRREDVVRKQHTLETQARVIPARTAASCQEEGKKNPFSHIWNQQVRAVLCKTRLRMAAEDLSDSTAAQIFKAIGKLLKATKLLK